jgi:hypothetical protein
MGPDDMVIHPASGCTRRQASALALLVLPASARHLLDALAVFLGAASLTP